jgi:hypothetical protein
MAANEHLNEALFHGTGRKFKKGEIVLPASKAGVKQNWGAKSKNDPNVAHATDSLDSAKYFASVASLVSSTSDKTARARVYQVEPVNPESANWTEKRFAGGKGGASSLREHTSAEGYRVVKRVWINKKQER